VVVTRLPEIPVHVEAYASPEAVREEEFSPAYALPAGAPLIVPADDVYALDSAMRTPSRVISYGIAESATVRLGEVEFSHRDGIIDGMQAVVTTGDETGSLVVRGSVGTTQLLPAAAALAVASALGIALPEALTALETYMPPPGRGRIFAGKNNSLIIDDSYNASPAAVEEALKTLKTVPHAMRPHSAEASRGRRIAVLGDMLELGRYSVMEHERIAELAEEAADVIVTVGIRARAFGTAVKGVEVIRFDNSRAAAAALPALIHDGDVLLVKGSQSIRTERIVEALLANPADAVKLVRQEREWKRRV
jgi:UDP-N-acetylmuramoyl-tripeptide--D-alanyl-D-alanine ligase